MPPPTNGLNSNGYFREIMRARSRRLGYFREEKGIRVLGGILGKLVQDRFEMVFDVEPVFLHRVYDAHEYAAGVGTRIRDGSKADLTGNDRGSKISFGQIIIGRDLAILSPVVEMRSVFKEDFLDAADTQMRRGGIYDSKDLGFDLSRLGIKVRVLDGLGSEFHGRGQKGSHHADEGLDFVGVGEVSF